MITDLDTVGENHERKEAETEVLQLQATECRILLANHPQLEGGEEGFSTTVFRGNMAQLTIGFWIPVSRIVSQ